MDTALLLKALGDPTRFMIFQQILSRKHCVRSLSKKLGISESAVSQHMKILREAGLVYGERFGYHIHYLPSFAENPGYATANSEKRESDMNILFEFFLTFAKIGLFTFGGGYAMISMIEHACVDSKQWVSHDDMMKITVIAESTPGPIAINCATFVGYKQKGLVGAIAATLGIELPSFIVIYLIAMLLDNFLEIAVIANAFKGIKLA